MKLKCSLTNYGYQIGFEEPYIPTDDNIIAMEIFGIITKQYHELLIEYGARRIQIWSGYTYIFNSKRDTLRAIEKLEPLLIMKKLEDI